jgi:DNA repair exonuclease SbcCD ATPase subunit
LKDLQNHVQACSFAPDASENHSQGDDYEDIQGMDGPDLRRQLNRIKACLVIFIITMIITFPLIYWAFSSVTSSTAHQMAKFELDLKGLESEKARLESDLKEIQHQLIHENKTQQELIQITDKIELKLNLTKKLFEADIIEIRQQLGQENKTLDNLKEIMAKFEEEKKEENIKLESDLKEIRDQLVHEKKSTQDLNQMMIKLQKEVDEIKRHKKGSDALSLFQGSSDSRLMLIVLLSISFLNTFFV